MPEGRSWDEVIDELKDRLERSSSPDEMDAAKGALEEAERQRDEEGRTPMGPPLLMTSEVGESKDWPPGNIVLGGRDHGKDAVELRARHVERGALSEARGTLGRLRIVATEFAARLDGLPALEDLRVSGAFVADLNAGREFLGTAIAALETFEIEKAAHDAAIAARHLFDAAKANLKGLSDEAGVSSESLRIVSRQARRSAAQLRMALAMRNLTHDEARMLHETTALDVAALLQAHASEGMRFVYGEGVWSVHGVPGTVIHADEFGSALAQALTRLRRA